MTLVDSMRRLFAGGGSRGWQAQSTMAPPNAPLDPLSDITTYRTLRAMYDNNGLYEELQFILNTRGLWKEALQPLRCPANRVVEFHAANICPGSDLDEALPIEANNESVTKAIKQIWKWSNWAAKKQVAVRWMPIYGDLLIKVVGKMDPARVFFQLLEAENATELLSDERGYLIHVRLDIPIWREDPKGGPPKAITVTEVWDKPTDSLKIWEHEKGQAAPIRDLGEPKRQYGILETFKVDFIPIAQGKFKDLGDERGQGAYQHAFDKIIEADRQVTRLHQMAFRHSNVFWALSSVGRDVNGRPIPAPQIQSVDGVVSSVEMAVGDDRFLALPGDAKMESLVPNLPYGELLAMLQDQMRELQDDLPEMKYYRMTDLGSQLSGRAVRLLLSDAIARAHEARGNFEDVLIRADQMALTIGQRIGALPGLDGSYEKGTFEHTFTKRQIIPTDDLEDAQASLTEAQAGLAWQELGLSRKEILRKHGYSDAEIAKLEVERADEQKQEQDASASLLDQFNRGNVPGNRNGATS